MVKKKKKKGKDWAVIVIYNTLIPHTVSSKVAQIPQLASLGSKLS